MPTPAGLSPAPRGHSLRRFLLRLTLAQAGLLAGWLPFGQGYRDVVVQTGNFIAGQVFTPGLVVFQHYGRLPGVAEASRANIAVLVRRNSRNHPGSYIVAREISPFYQPYQATAFLAALFLATGGPWRQGLRRFALAALVLHGAMLAAVTVDVVHTGATEGVIASPFPGAALTTLALLRATVIDWPAGVLIVPLLCWLACRASTQSDQADRPSFLSLPRPQCSLPLRHAADGDATRQNRGRAVRS